MSEKVKQLEALAKAIRNITYNAHGATLIGPEIPVVQRLGNRMNDIKIGDLIVEISTIWMQQRSDLDGLGYLIRIEQEPVDFGPRAEPWDEKEEGQPHPTERCTYIKTLDGREFRWTNASFIAAPIELLR